MDKQKKIFLGDEYKKEGMISKKAQKRFFGMWLKVVQKHETDNDENSQKYCFFAWSQALRFLEIG